MALLLLGICVIKVMCQYSILLQLQQRGTKEDITQSHSSYCIKYNILISSPLEAYARQKRYYIFLT